MKIFEKGKRGPNEPKVTLFTIGTELSASRLNVTIYERNLIFEKKKPKVAHSSIQTISKGTGPTVFPLKYEPFIPSTGNFQGIIFHPCMVYHIDFIISLKLWKCEQFEKKWEKREYHVLIDKK